MKRSNVVVTLNPVQRETSVPRWWPVTSTSQFPQTSRATSLNRRLTSPARLRSTAERDGYFARSGMTLFEVVLALAVFLGSFAAIAQIVDVGRQASVDGQLESEAVLRAQTKLAEVIAGVEPMSAISAQPFDDDPNWSWGLTINDGPYLDVLALTITVEHVRPNGSVDGAFVLNRLVRDPQLFIDAATSASLSEEG